MTAYGHMFSARNVLPRLRQLGASGGISAGSPRTTPAGSSREVSPLVAGLGAGHLVYLCASSPGKLVGAGAHGLQGVAHGL